MKGVICLVAGIVAGESLARLAGVRLLELEHVRALEVPAEAALVVCLFCAGLRLSAPLEPAAWRVPLRLAAITLPLTVALIAGAARVGLGLPIEEAILLGAILAPTDPVLASMLDLPAADRRAVSRFALSAEGALTSSLGLPLVVLALGLCGGGELGPFGSRWAALELILGLAGGVLLGALVGTLGAWTLARFDSRGEIGLAELLVLATTLACTYGAALILGANGLVAALAAGGTLARGGISWRRKPQAAWLNVRRPPRLARRLAAGAERIELVMALAAVSLIGMLLPAAGAHPAAILFALAVLVGVRPLAARLGLGGEPLPEGERQTLAWFGARGTASLYFLLLSIDEAPSAEIAGSIAAVALAVLAASIALHGLTALPFGRRPAREQGSR